jgi:RimJ/RimL family protein N-acetyltransferase
MVNRISRTLNSARDLGLRTTYELILVKVASVLELFFPGTIWGDQVGLRSIKSPLTDTEVEKIYGWSIDEEILRWSGGSRSKLSLEEFRNKIHHDRWKAQSGQRLFYIISKTGEIIGRVGLFSIDWRKLEGEFGISIDKEYWSKHFGREATRLLTQYIFTKTPIKRIYLGTFQDNLRAQHSFMASGFRVTGTTSRFFPHEGRYVDGVEMEITRQDFKRI